MLASPWRCSWEAARFEDAVERCVSEFSSFWRWFEVAELRRSEMAADFVRGFDASSSASISRTEVVGAILVSSGDSSRFPLSSEWRLDVVGRSGRRRG